VDPTGCVVVLIEVGAGEIDDVGHCCCLIVVCSYRMTKHLNFLGSTAA
jgi:hypothetical protein